MSGSPWETWRSCNSLSYSVENIVMDWQYLKSFSWFIRVSWYVCFMLQFPWIRKCQLVIGIRNAQDQDQGSDSLHGKPAPSSKARIIVCTTIDNNRHCLAVIGANLSFRFFHYKLDSLCPWRLSKYGEGMMYWTEVRSKGFLRCFGFNMNHMSSRQGGYFAFR